MVVETLWPDSAPWWLNLFIWMALFWQYILIGFIPAFYMAITKLFGMPLLQRWSKEVVIMLYPSSVKFGKITQQYQPYFRHNKGVYWMADPLQPTRYDQIPQKQQEKLDKLKQRYEELMAKQTKTPKEEKEIENILKEQMRAEKKSFTVDPVNQLHIFTHAVNQPVYDMQRRDTKVDEILNNEPKIKKIPGHGIWIMRNPKAHFHRHYQIIVNHTATSYVIVPVKERQQFGIGFWHSIGIVMLREEESEKQVELGGAVGGNKQLIQKLITTSVVLQQMKEVQDFQNFSASRSFSILKRRAKIEDNFMLWVTGSINPIIFVVLGGAVAVIAAIYMFMHGQAPPAGPPVPGKIL